MTFVPPGTPARRIIPLPSALAAKPRPRVFSPAVALGVSRVDRGIYVADTGIGLAFAAVEGGLEMLADHLGGRLVYTDDVRVEWEAIAGRPVWPPDPGHKPSEQVEYRRKLLVKQTAAPVAQELARLVGPPVELDVADLQPVEDLIGELCALIEPKPVGSGDRGECASIRLAMKLRYGPACSPPATGTQSDALPVVVVALNDDRGRRLASIKGIGTRSAAELLREMVADERFDEQTAWQHHRAMATVTRPAQWATPTGPEWFTP